MMLSTDGANEEESVEFASPFNTDWEAYGLMTARRVELIEAIKLLADSFDWSEMMTAAGLLTLDDASTSV